MCLRWAPVAEGFQNIGVVAYRKDMDFRKEFAFQVGKKLIAFLVTVPLAFWWHSYWALVIGLLAGKAGGTVLSFVVHPYRPRFAMSAHVELFRFSRWLVLNNLLRILRYRMSDFIVGKISGPGPLGLFTLSYELAQLPTNELVAPINRAVYPAYARMSGNLHVLRQSYLDVVGMIALFALPAAMGIAVLAEPIVQVVLGPRWMAAVPLIQVLGVTGAINAMETNIGSVYLALGRPAILSALFGFYVALIMLLLAVFTGMWGALGAAWACLLAAVLNIPVYYTAMMKTLDLRLAEFLAVLWRPLLASAGMYALLAAGINQGGILWGEVPIIVLLAGGVMLGVTAYGGMIWFLWMLAGRPGSAAEAVILRRFSALPASIRRRLASI